MVLQSKIFIYVKMIQILLLYYKFILLIKINEFFILIKDNNTKKLCDANSFETFINNSFRRNIRKKFERLNYIYKKFTKNAFYC